MFAPSMSQSGRWWGLLALAVASGCSPSLAPVPRAPCLLPTAAKSLPLMSELDHGPTVAVLLIAVQEPQTILSDEADALKFVLDDARQLRDDFLGLGVPDGNVVLLQEEQATAAAVTRELAKLAGKLLADDTVFIVFLGHGVMRQSSEFVLYDRTVPVKELLNELMNGPAAKAVLIADACHSGRPGAPSFALRDDQVARDGGVAWIVSAQGDQHAYEDPKLGHGVFTFYLSRILRNAHDYDRNGDDALSVTEIARQLQEDVLHWSETQFRSIAQRPQSHFVNWPAIDPPLLPIHREWGLTVLDAGLTAKVCVQFPPSQVGENDRVCLIVAPELTRPRYYPQQNVELARRDGPVWKGTVQLGSGPKEIGETFEIGVVLADPDLQARLKLVGNDYSTSDPPLSALPLKALVNVRRTH